jgi:hypothetical protein
MRIQAGALLAAVLAFASAPALRATTVTSYSVSNWISSINSGTAKDVDFTHIQYISYGPSGYTSSDGYNITGSNSSGSFLQGISYQSQPSLKSDSDSASQLKVAIPGSGNTALLFLLASTPSTSGYTVTLSDGEIFNLSGSTTIFGVSVSHPITSVNLSAGTGSNLILEDVSYGVSNLPSDNSGGSGGGSGGGGGGGSTPPSDPGNPSAVPEATPVLLLGTGLGMIAFARKRISLV